MYQMYWFLFTCLILYGISIHLNYCRLYGNDFFTRSDPFEWLWNGYYLISSSLIDRLLACICMLYLCIWVILAGMFLVVFTRTNFSVYWCKNHYFISSSLINSLLALICMLFCLIWIFVAGMSVAVSTRIYLFCMVLYWLLSYIEFIYWFVTYFNLYNVCSAYVIGCLQEVVALYDCKLFINFCPVYWIIY